MKTNKRTINGKEFLEVELIPVRQKGKEFYIGKIPARYLLDLYSVRPTKYDIQKNTYLASTFKDDEEYYNYLIDKKREGFESYDAERDLKEERVKDIKDYINGNEYAIFPNTIIVTCDLINNLIEIDNKVSIDDLVKIEDISLPYLLENADSNSPSILYVPYVPDSLLVVDGQHRLAGLEAAEDWIKDDYEVLVAFILGFARSVTAELFYTINYEQKPVNRSLLYHLMGEFSDELDNITFMHETVKILNEVERSPFFTRVKMLGKIPEGTPKEIREKMTISQAFLIESLERTISFDAMGSQIYPPIFLYYYYKEKKRTEIIKFIAKYFQAISRVKDTEWNNPKESIICNAMGIGALVKVMHFIFVKIFIEEEFGLNPDKIEKVTVDSLCLKLAGLENMVFSKDNYRGASSAGGLNQLVKDIVIKINYLEAPSYEEFTEKYKKEYVAPFKQWLAQNVEKPKE